MSLLCLKELVLVPWNPQAGCALSVQPHRHGLYSLPSSVFKTLLFSFFFVPAGERLKGKCGGGG